MKHVFTGMAAVCLSALSLSAQVCNPSTAPTGLSSTYTPGSGALLEWDAVPGSIGVQLKIDLPAGPAINRRIIGPSLDQFFVPDALLSPGTYTWRVQAACSTSPPYDVTPISASSSFTVSVEVICPATATDIDGNVYNIVKIGDQCWMAENLKVERYSNGDSIPTGLSNSAWSSTTSDAFAVYNDEAANKATYGLLYNWFAVVDPRGLCPTGWHVPADAELTQLKNHLGLRSGGQMKTTGTLEAGTGLWLFPNKGADNSSGFSGLPGGYRSNSGNFFLQGYYGDWWLSDENGPGYAKYWRLRYDDPKARSYSNNKRYGFSVRCLRD